MSNLISLKSGIDARITGSRFERIFHEFIYNSAHLPFAILLIELLTHLDGSPPNYAFLLALAAAGIVQACVLGVLDFQGRPKPLLGNLVGPLVVTLAGTLGESWHFLGDHPQYELYWAFAFLVGLATEVRWRSRLEVVQHACILLENVLRAVFILVLAWLVRETLTGSYAGWDTYLSLPQHLYIVVIIPLFGALNGLSHINTYRYLLVLRETAKELRQYSEWTLGAEVLRNSLGHAERLRQRRTERSIVFMDIRRFTRWSLHESPESVVGVVDDFCRTVEAALAPERPLKLEFTGDEAFAVFETPGQAARGALAAMEAVQPRLARVGLAAGASVSSGTMVEGLVGGRHLKKYTVIGDVVNCGKHVCDQALPGEVLISVTPAHALKDVAQLGPGRTVEVAGRDMTLFVMPLLSIAPGARAGEAAPARKPWGEPARGLATEDTSRL